MVKKKQSEGRMGQTVAKARANTERERLNLRNDGISAFLRDTFNHLELVSDLPRAVRAIDRAGWTEAIEARTYDIIKAIVLFVLAPGRDSRHVRTVLDPLRMTVTLLETRSNTLDYKVSAYTDLLQDRLNRAGSHRLEKAWQRKHVREIYDFLPEGEQVPRAEIRAHFDLGDANLSRVLNGMEDAGLIERETLGRDKLVRRIEVDDRILPSVEPEPENDIDHVFSYISHRSGKTRLLSCVDDSATSFVILYAHEIGLTDKYGFDVDVKRLDPTIQNSNEIWKIYRSNEAPVSRQCVVHSLPTWACERKVRQSSSAVFFLGTQVGGRLLGGEPSKQFELHNDAPKGVEKVWTFVNRFHPENEIDIVYPDEDAGAKRFSSKVLQALGKPRQRKTSISSAPVSDSRWCAPADNNKLESYWQPFPIDTMRYSWLTFRDLEESTTEDFDGFFDEGQRRSDLYKAFRRLNRIKLAELADHWSINAGIASQRWRDDEPMAKEVLARLYEMSVDLLEQVRGEEDDYFSFVSKSMSGASGLCVSDITTDQVRSAVKDSVRFSDMGSYIDRATENADKYYWPSEESGAEDWKLVAEGLHLDFGNK